MNDELPDQLHTGERIRILRERRGLSRPVLAGLVGKSPDWLKKIESGKRSITSVTLLVRLAQAMRIKDVSVLTGGEVTLPVGSVGKLSHPSLPEIRTAMHSVSFAPAGEAPTPEVLASQVEDAWHLWHTSMHQRTEVGARLPKLIRDAHACIRAHDGDQRRHAHAATADLYRLVQRMIAHISEPELYWTALDRGRAHSEEADQPVSLALSAWSTAIGQRATGYVDEAVRTDEWGMAVLKPYLDSGDRTVIGAYGALSLQAAISYGLDGRAGDAERYLDQADRVANQLPAGYVHEGTAFDAFNVAVHRVGVGVGVRTPGEALRYAESIVPEKITSLERRSRLLLDIAAAHQARGEDASALHYLSKAYEVTPEGVRYVPTARALAAEVVRRAKGPWKAEAVSLAESIGMST